MANETENKSLLMPSVCLALAVLIVAVSVPNSPLSSTVEEAFHQSVSIRSSQFLLPECTNLTRLPYTPANPAFGNWRPHGTLGFILVSAHRLSATGFVVMGLTPVTRHTGWGTSSSMQELCLWVSFEPTFGIQGELDFHFPEEGRNTDQYLYDIVVVHCKLSKPTPKNAGGALFVNIQGVDEVLVLREDPGIQEVNPPLPLPNTLTVCSTLLTHSELGRQAPQRMAEHMQVLRFMGADAFALYDGGGVSAELASELVPFIGAGLVEFVNFTGLSVLSVAVDDVTINDCSYRMRFRSSWVLQLAPDEIVSVPQSDSNSKLMGADSLAGLLRMHSGVPWISLGVYVWDVEMCFNIQVSEEWWQERMIWRSFNPLCLDAPNGTDFKTCRAEKGKRRLIFDPQKVALMLEHRVISPDLEGLVLNTDLGQVDKFLGLLSPAALICEYPVAEDHHTEQWQADKRLRELIKQGRASKLIALPQ